MYYAAASTLRKVFPPVLGSECPSQIRSRNVVHWGLPEVSSGYASIHTGGVISSEVNVPTHERATTTPPHTDLEKESGCYTSLYQQEEPTFPGWPIPTNVATHLTLMTINLQSYEFRMWSGRYRVTGKASTPSYNQNTYGLFRRRHI